MRWLSERTYLLLESVSLVTYDYDTGSDCLSYYIPRGAEEPETVRVERYVATLEQNGVTHPRDVAALRAALKAAMKAPCSGSLLCRVNLRGVGYRKMKMHYRSIAGTDGKVYRVIGKLEEA